MENKIFAYMRISTNHKTQKTDRQRQAIIEYSICNGFNIDEFVSDIITGGTKADNRPNYHNMKKQLRNGDTLIISDIDRLGRNADDVIVEIKDLQSKGIRVVALDVPFLNDWEKMNDDSLSKMIIDIFVTLKAHMAQQEKEKIHDRVMQGLGVEAGKKQLADHIQHQFEIGKPVEINGELYWMKDAKQNLMDIMNDIESAWNEEHGVKKFIVPLKHPYKEITRKVIIEAETAEQAMINVLLEFEQGCGWIVDTDYENYKRLRE